MSSLWVRLVQVFWLTMEMFCNFDEAFVKQIAVGEIRLEILRQVVF
jgi:hypothetical protein